MAISLAGIMDEECDMSMLPIYVAMEVEAEVAVGMSDMAVPIAIVIVDMSILKGSQAVSVVGDSQSSDGRIIGFWFPSALEILSQAGRVMEFCSPSQLSGSRVIELWSQGYEVASIGIN
jgi:hypothetical protein